MAEGMRYPEGSPFPPIAEYAFLSDRDVKALVAKRGFSMAHRVVT